MAYYLFHCSISLMQEYQSTMLMGSNIMLKNHNTNALNSMLANIMQHWKLYLPIHISILCVLLSRVQNSFFYLDLISYLCKTLIKESKFWSWRNNKIFLSLYDFEYFNSLNILLNNTELKPIAQNIGVYGVLKPLLTITVNSL